MSDTGPSWDEISAIAAVITIHAGIIGWGSKKLWEYWNTYWLLRRKCIKLGFDDIPPGRIHGCQRCSVFNHEGFHIREQHQQEYVPLTGNWEGHFSLAAVFEQAWDQSIKHPKLVPVPQSWPADVPTFVTDFRTLVAFLLCTAPASLPSFQENIRQTRNGIWEVRIKKMFGYHYALIRGSIQNWTRMLTKSEIDLLVSGYPPWYREKFYTYNKTIGFLEFPIRDSGDLSRGGWVVAVGLMAMDYWNHIDQMPLPMYVTRSDDKGGALRLIGDTYFRRAIFRCRDHIKNNIYPHFPDNEIVLEALRNLDYFLDFGTDSGLYSSLLLDVERKLPITHMTSSADCNFVMQNFKNYSALEADEVLIYQQIILPAMAAVVGGALEITRYFKMSGRDLILPDDLELDDEMFLVDNLGSVRLSYM